MKKIFFLVMFQLFCSSALVFSQTTSDDYTKTGNNLYINKDYNQALASYQSAVLADPANWRAHQGLANTFYVLGQKDAALNEYQEALKINPNIPGVATLVQALRFPATSVPSTTSANLKEPAASGELEVRLMAGYTSFGMPSQSGSLNGNNASAEVDYLLDPNWGVGLTVAENQTVPGGYPVFYSFSFVEVLTNVKYRFGTKDFQPYLWGGLGANINIADVETHLGDGNDVTTSASSVYPEMSVGTGVEYWFHPGFNAFVQARYDLILSNGGTTSLIPVSVGLSFLK